MHYSFVCIGKHWMRYNGKYEEITSQLVKARGELYLLLYVALFSYDWVCKNRQYYFEPDHTDIALLE